MTDHCPALRPETCATCHHEGRRGYCAPLRCYCGHDTCPAFASWEPLEKPRMVAVPEIRPTSTTWDDREESTWIDQM